MYLCSWPNKIFQNEILYIVQFLELLKFIILHPDNWILIWLQLCLNNKWGTIVLLDAFVKTLPSSSELLFAPANWYYKHTHIEEDLYFYVGTMKALFSMYSVAFLDWVLF